jgi:hypothetical protein
MPIQTIQDFDTADSFAAAASSLLAYRVAHDPELTDEEWDDLRDREHALLAEVVKMRAAGVGALAQMTANSRDAVVSGMESMNKFLERISRVEKLLGVATAAIQLAAAIASGNAMAIVNSAVALKNTATST